MGEKSKETLLFIHHGASLGGAPTSLFEVLKRIDTKRYKVITVLPERGPFSDLLETEKVKYRFIPLFIFYYCSLYKTPLNLNNLFRLSKDAFGNLLALIKILAKEKSATVIINSSMLLLCGVIAKIMKKRVIWHIREIISTEKAWIVKKIIATIINFSAEKVIVNSEFSLRDMNNLGIKKTVLIYNGVDLVKFYKRDILNKQSMQTVLGSSNATVGFAGQIYKEKGWPNLIKASFLVIQNMRGIKFIIMGSGNMVKRIKGKTARKNITS